jgi:thiol:disulfide interchange protein DsbC
MKKNKLALLVATFILGATSLSYAKEPEAFNPATTLNLKEPYGFIYLNKPAKDFQKAIPAPEVLTKIQKKFPSFKALEATHLVDIDLYEIIAETTPSLVYTNKDLSYFIINGEIVDANKLVGINTERNKKFVANFVKNNAKSNEIQLILGDPKAANRRNIIIFTDPDCPFCKALDKEIHQTLKGENITITYLMNPLHELPGHEQAPEKAAKLWCAEDKNKAWENWMLVGELPTNDGSCVNPTKEHSKFARRNDLLQTPTIFFDNGYFFKGQPTTKQIVDVLGGAGVRPD